MWSFQDRVWSNRTPRYWKFQFFERYLKFNSSLLAYWSDQLERIQKRSLRIIYPDLSYSEALTKSSMSTFQERRELLCRKLFMEIFDSKGHKLHQLLPSLNVITYKTRKRRKFRVPQWDFSSSFIMHYASQLLRY